MSRSVSGGHLRHPPQGTQEPAKSHLILRVVYMAHENMTQGGILALYTLFEPKSTIKFVYMHIKNFLCTFEK